LLHAGSFHHSASHNGPPSSRRKANGIRGDGADVVLSRLRLGTDKIPVPSRHGDFLYQILFFPFRKNQVTKAPLPQSDTADITQTTVTNVRS